MLHEMHLPLHLVGLVHTNGVLSEAHSKTWRIALIPQDYYCSSLNTAQEHVLLGCHHCVLIQACSVLLPSPAAFLLSLLSFLPLFRLHLFHLFHLFHLCHLCHIFNLVHLYRIYLHLVPSIHAPSFWAYGREAWAALGGWHTEGFR